MQTEINKMQRHIRISDVIDVLMSQSLQLMDIVKKNQEEVNKLKQECDNLELREPNDIKGGW